MDKAIDAVHSGKLAHAHGNGVDAARQRVCNKQIFFGVGFAEVCGPILRLARCRVLDLPHRRVQQRRGPVDPVFLQRQRIRPDGLHRAAHLARHGGAVQPAAHLLFADAAHHRAQAAVVTDAHHRRLRRFDYILFYGFTVFVAHYRAVRIVFRRLRGHTQPSCGEKGFVLLGQRPFHLRLQHGIHRGVDAQTAVVKKVGRFVLIQMIARGQLGRNLREHLIGKIAGGWGFGHGHVARRKADRLRRGLLVFLLRDIALLPHLVQNVVAPGQMLLGMGARVVPIGIFCNRRDGRALRQRQFHRGPAEQLDALGLYTRRIVGKADDVQIRLHDLILIVFRIQTQRAPDFAHLAQIPVKAARFVVARQIFDQLLVDGRGALLDAVAKVAAGEHLFGLIQHRVHRAGEGHAVMRIKVLVLNGDKRVLHGKGDLGKRRPDLLLRCLEAGIFHPFAALAVLSV